MHDDDEQRNTSRSSTMNHDHHRDQAAIRNLIGMVRSMVVRIEAAERAVTLQAAEIERLGVELVELRQAWCGATDHRRQPAE